MTKKKCVTFIFLIFMFNFCVANESGLVSLKVDTVKNENRPMLICSIKNISKETLSFYKNNLPCAGLYSLLLLVVRDKDQHVLQEAEYLIDDPSPILVSIPPGGTVDNKLDLSARVDGVMSESKNNNLIIFWSYVPVLANGKKLAREGGWLQFHDNSYSANHSLSTK